MRNLLGLVLAGLMTGCVAHAVLPLVPTRGAPLAERQQAFKELAPVTGSEAAQQAWGWGRPQDFVLLSNGLRVMDATDLLPAVDPGSPTATFAKAATDRFERARIAHGIGAGLGAVAVGLMFGSLAFTDTHSNAGPSNTGLGMVFAGAGVGFLALIPMIIGLVQQADAAVEQRSAFLMYPKDLRKRLALDEEVVLPAAPPSPNLLPQISP